MTKICTDIEQSKLLAEILPKESADMMWCFDDIEEEPFMFPYRTNIFEDSKSKDIPAWSLAALLDLIPFRLDDGSDFFIEKWEDGYMATYGASCHKYGNELVDACYAMILNLHERKLL